MLWGAARIFAVAICYQVATARTAEDSLIAHLHSNNVAKRAKLTRLKLKLHTIVTENFI